jgi:hypothetical protein
MYDLSVSMKSFLANEVEAWPLEQMFIASKCTEGGTFVYLNCKLLGIIIIIIIIISIIKGARGRLVDWGIMLVRLLLRS